jgi:hypothetical protein
MAERFEARNTRESTQMSSQLIETLIAAATAAPSGDNKQPWRFESDAESGRIAIYVDPTRDPSPMNSGQRMARIAIGAAVENILITARDNGWSADFESPPPGAVAMVKVTADDTRQARIDPLLTSRVTNRRPYDGRPVPDDVVANLIEKTPPLDGVITKWMVDRRQIKQFAELDVASDVAFFGQPAIRNAFLSAVRFDVAPDAKVDDGLPLASLEMGAAGQFMRILQRLPNWLVHGLGVPRSIAKTCRRLTRSSSGVCVVIAPDGAETTDLLVGRATQRAWLALAAHGLCAQPMMTAPCLNCVLQLGATDVIESIGRSRLESIAAQFQTLIPECEHGQLAWSMRFGYAPPVSARTGRRPWRDVTREASLSPP